MGIGKRDFEELKAKFVNLRVDVKSLKDQVDKLKEENAELKAKFEEAVLAIQKGEEDEKKFKEAMDEYLKPII